MAISKKTLKLVILFLCGALLASSPAFAVDFAKGKGDGVCPQGYRLATTQEVAQNSTAACQVLGTWDIARLADGGSMSGSGYKCGVFDTDSRSLGDSLCAKDMAPPASKFYPDPGAWYRLRTQFQGDDKCLEGNDPDKGVKGGNAFLDSCQNVSGQLWRFVSVEGQAGYYRMKTQFQGDNKCLEGNQSGSKYHDGAAFLDNCQNVSGQMWRFEDSGDWLRLKTMFRGEGECLEGNDPVKGIKDGSAFMDKCQNVSGQLWSITSTPLPAPQMFKPDASQWYRLRTQFQGVDKCLEGNDPDKGVKGGNAFLDSCQNVSGQLWRFVSVEGQAGYYRMKTQFQGDNKCLEGNQSGSKYHDGAAFLDNCQNVSGQMWRFENSGDWLRLKTMFRGEGECLEGNDPVKGIKDGSAFMDKCQNVSGQLWSITSTPLPAPQMFKPDASQWYRLRTQFQGVDKCLEGNDPDKGVKGGNAFLDSCQNVSGQLWRFVSVEGQAGYYRMKTQFQGDNKCLEGNQSGSKYHDGAAFLDNCQNVSGQMWRFENSGDWLRLKTMFRGEGECLEGNDPVKGIKDGSAFMDKCQNVSGQLWSIKP